MNKIKQVVTIVATVLVVVLMTVVLTKLIKNTRDFIEEGFDKKSPTVEEQVSEDSVYVDAEPITQEQEIPLQGILFTGEKIDTFSTIESHDVEQGHEIQDISFGNNENLDIWLSELQPNVLYRYSVPIAYSYNIHNNTGSSCVLYIKTTSGEDNTNNVSSLEYSVIALPGKRLFDGITGIGLPQEKQVPSYSVLEYTNEDGFYYVLYQTIDDNSLRDLINEDDIINVSSLTMEPYDVFDKDFLFNDTGETVTVCETSKQFEQSNNSDIKAGELISIGHLSIDEIHKIDPDTVAP